MDPDAQVGHKQARLLADFAAHGLTPERVLAPLRSEPWAYRRRARLGCKLVPGKGKVVVGFREKDRRFIADLERCEVLAGPGGALIPLLSEQLGALEIAAKIPQIEVSVADDEPGAPTALVMRVLEPPGPADLERLRALAREHDLRIFLQPGGLDTVAPLDEDTPALLDYRLPAYDLRLSFRPTDFVQVNAGINRAMIDQALELLAVEPQHRVLDLFCGLGNFSLPLARRAHAGEVLGVEGDRGLVERARANAAQNHLANARFETRDLYTQVGELEWLHDGSTQPFDRVLLDPPRSGALAIVEQFAAIAAPRVVYVACSPSSLARDAAVLVERHGYHLRAAG
ncbi:MAG: methyltransferase domain-containing protein, partial [Myxococcales bacterium]|nr:methyltransferase domain-containing protein [Myxococcales bacterium]